MTTQISVGLRVQVHIPVKKATDSDPNLAIHSDSKTPASAISQHRKTLKCHLQHKAQTEVHIFELTAPKRTFVTAYPFPLRCAGDVVFLLILTMCGLRVSLLPVRTWRYCCYALQCLSNGSSHLRGCTFGF